MLPQSSQPHDASDERDQLRLLLDVTNAVVSNLSLQELLYTVSEWLRRFFPIDLASMVIQDEKTGIANATRSTVLRDRIKVLGHDQRRQYARMRVQRDHNKLLLDELAVLPTSTLRNRMKKLGLK